ncbi:hypothetical protein N7456_002518 [Penicillium angulare]|uniref:Uncharacterized protein n=1 Tax=Penicillium angulare TaxID=116970 RepID=A0A9W9KP25_9EURO|nr:hypothetical protein N7456_002518 [Penicillium angulare]
MKYPRPIVQCDMEVTAESYDQGADVGSGYSVKASFKLIDRWLDKLVQLAGSAPIFSLLMIGLIVWAVAGIWHGNSETWIAAISDIQALICYIYDSVLMRQLFRKYHVEHDAMLQIQSRCGSHRRMIAYLKGTLGEHQIHQLAMHVNEIHSSSSSISKKDDPFVIDSDLRTPGYFARYIISMANTCWHIISVGGYWLCIFIWLGFACLRECYAAYNNTYLDAIFKLDTTIEIKLRHLTRDTLPNSTVIKCAPKENFLQRAVFYYADIVGALVGIMLLVVVLLAWIAVGPVFKYNQSWWLLIGTYAGLVGLFDSFVLRNVQGKISRYIDEDFDILDESTKDILDELYIFDSSASIEHQSITLSLSAWMDGVSSNVIMVFAGFLLTVGCLIASSALKWSLTGQLISNVPPNIIETLLMLILITGQNDAEAKSRARLADIYSQRQRLMLFVQHAKRALDKSKD